MPRLLTLASTLLLAVVAIAPAATAQTIDLQRTIEDVNRATSAERSAESSRTVRFAHVAGQYTSAFVPVDDDDQANDILNMLGAAVNALGLPTVCLAPSRSTDCVGATDVNPYVYCTVDLEVIYSYDRPLGQISTDLDNDSGAYFDCPGGYDYSGSASVSSRAYVRDAGVSAVGGIQDIACPGGSNPFGGCDTPQRGTGPSAFYTVGADLSIPVFIAANDRGIPELHGTGSAYDWATIFTISISGMGEFEYCAAASEVDSLGDIDVAWYSAQEAASLPFVNPCAGF